MYIQTTCYIMRLGEADCVFCSTFWLIIDQERPKITDVPTTLVITYNY